MNKASCSLRSRQLTESVLRDISNTPFIQHEEITWIHTTISFYNVLQLALTNHAAGADRPVRKQLQMMIKKAHMHVIALSTFLLP